MVVYGFKEDSVGGDALNEPVGLSVACEASALPLSYVPEATDCRQVLASPIACRPYSFKLAGGCGCSLTPAVE
jgi:hypothetical protein